MAHTTPLGAAAPTPGAYAVTHFAPGALNSAGLPFVGNLPASGKRRPRRTHWSPAPQPSYASGNAQGAAYAASLLNYYRANPAMVGAMLAGIVEDMRQQPEDSAADVGQRGTRVGFFAFLESAVVYALATGFNPSDRAASELARLSPYLSTAAELEQQP
jgi:hypothetical protein